MMYFIHTEAHWKNCIFTGAIKDKILVQGHCVGTDLMYVFLNVGVSVLEVQHPRVVSVRIRKLQYSCIWRTSGLPD